MLEKWKLSLVVGFTVAVVSLMMNYATPNISRFTQVIVIGSTAALSSGISYKVIFQRKKKS